MKTSFHRIAVTSVVAVLMAGILPISSTAPQPAGFCSVFPWWPTCQRAIV